VVAVLAATLVVGAAVQGMVGLGVGLVAAPVVTMLAPELMPATLLMVALLMPVVTLWHDHHDIDWPGLAWSVPARVPGTVLGVWLVTVVTERTLGIVVGVVVLAGVLATVRAVELPVNRMTLSAAGLVSGVTGTATSIGGPPVAVLYQHRPAGQIRSTLAVYFLLGAAFSLIGLAVAGEVERRDVWLSVLLLPCLVLGVWLARVVRRLADPGSIRAGVLVVCAASAVALLVRSLIG
jgi:uncharacterized membrane protein YfcA